MGIKSFLRVSTLAPVFSVVLIIYLITHIGIQDKYHQVAKAGIAQFLLGVFFMFLAALLSIWKSIWVAKQLDIEFKRQQPFPVLTLAFGLGVLVPIPGFMDLFRVWVMNKYLNLTSRDSIQFTLVDRVSGLLSLLIIATVGLLLFLLFLSEKAIELSGLLALILLLMGGVITAIFLIFGKYKFFYRYPLIDFIPDFIIALRQVLNNPSKWLVQLGLAMATSIIWSISLFLIAKDTSLNDYIFVQTLMPSILISNAVPIFFSGWGIRELVFIWLLGGEVGDYQSFTYSIYLGLMFSVCAVMVCILSMIIFVIDYLKNKRGSV